MIEIRKLTQETLPLLWTVEDRRLDSERVVIRTKVGGFDLDYKPLPGALWRVGNAERDVPGAPEDWLEQKDRDIFLGWLDEALAGQVLVEVVECNLARVRDVRVALSMRRRGVGESLMSMAEDWAQSRGLAGVMAETQDVNAGACQFLTSNGYELGGVDALRYIGKSKQLLKAIGLRETALFFYKFFR